jgi:hypothetical protein
MLSEMLQRLPTLHEVLTQATRCLAAEADSACLLGEDWEFIYTNPAWDRFAEENGGVSSTQAHLLGRSYVSFSSDAATRELLRSIQVRVSSGEAFTLFTRCDSPGVERRIASHFLPVWGGGFRGTAVLHLTIQAGASGQRLPWGQKDAALREGLSCASCHRVLRGGRPGWHLDERVIVPGAGLSSSYCPTCEGLLQWTGPLVASGACR